MSEKLNEVVVSGNRIYMEDGVIRTEPREDIQRTEGMSIEEAKELTLEYFKVKLRNDGYGI